MWVLQTNSQVEFTRIQRLLDGKSADEAGLLWFGVLDFATNRSNAFFVDAERVLDLLNKHQLAISPEGLSELTDRAPLELIASKYNPSTS